MGATLHEVGADAGPVASGRRPLFASIRPLGWVPVLTLAVFALPIGAGLAGTLLPAFGYLPAIGGSEPSLAPWRELFAWPGFRTSLVTTLFTGFISAIVSVALAFAFCAYASSRAWGRRAAAWVAPLLATPHSALAIGLAFVIAPSGWLVRAVSPWLTGWEVPPDVGTVGHPSGAALVFGLIVKEVPYLVLMIAGASNQIPWRAQVAAARSLGYGVVDAWVRVVLPQLYRQVRLPIYAVLAFSLSVVDVGLILGPSNPPTLAVLAVRWFTDADIRLYFPAAAAATLVLMIVILSIALWRAGEVLVAGWGRGMLERGRRGGALPVLAHIGARVAAALFALSLVTIAGLLLWAFATQWRFPDAWPAGFDIATWGRRVASLGAPTLTTLLVGTLATLVALSLALACLEFEQRRPSRAPPPALGLMYLPLLVPQIAFLFGAQVLLVRAGFDGALAAVVWAHLVFVLPYLFLSVADPYRALDRRYARSAASLGASPWRVFFAVKVPLLARPIAIACAVAFAVSVGQYLATLFAGNGRVATLTTEAVTLASGADRRVIATYALAQAALPLVIYLAALALPAWAFRNRRGLAA